MSSFHSLQGPVRRPFCRPQFISEKRTQKGSATCPWHTASECRDGWRARQRGSECILSILLWNREEAGLWAGSSPRPRALPVGHELSEASKRGTRYSLSAGPGSLIASTGHSVQNGSVQRRATPCPFTVLSLQQMHCEPWQWAVPRPGFSRPHGVHVPRAGCSGPRGVQDGHSLAPLVSRTPTSDSRSASAMHGCARLLWGTRRGGI